MVLRLVALVQAEEDAPERNNWRLLMASVERKFAQTLPHGESEAASLSERLRSLLGEQGFFFNSDDELIARVRHGEHAIEILGELGAWLETEKKA